MGEDLQHKSPKENLPFFLWGVGWQTGQGLRCQRYLQCFILTFSHFGHAALQFTKLSNLHFSFDSVRHPAGLVYTQETCGGAGKQSNFTNTEAEIVQGQMLREKRKKPGFPTPTQLSRSLSVLIPVFTIMCYRYFLPLIIIWLALGLNCMKILSNFQSPGPLTRNAIASEGTPNSFLPSLLGPSNHWISFLNP